MMRTMKIIENAFLIIFLIMCCLEIISYNFVFQTLRVIAFGGFWISYTIVRIKEHSKK